MPHSLLNPKGLTPSFNNADQSTPLRELSLSSREVYYYLINVEEHPEALPLAYDLVTRRLDDASTADAPLVVPAATDVARRLDSAIAELEKRRASFLHPWHHASEDQTRRQALYYLLQFMPTAFADGCWLQCGLRVSTAHTPVGASLTALYEHQVRAFIADPGRHYVAGYRATYSRLGTPLEEISSRSFAHRQDFQESTFSLPIFLLALSQFTRSFPGEILGVNLAWQFLDLSAFGPNLIKDVCEAYALPPLGEATDDLAYFDRGRTLAHAAVTTYLSQHDESEGDAAWTAVLRGINAGISAWTEWFTRIRAAAPTAAPDPRQEMLDMLWRKAPHAIGYHTDKKLVTSRIDDHLDPATFDGDALLTELANSRYVKAGRSDRSALVGHLVKFGGPMLAVFSPVELEIIQRWIDSLPPRGADGSAPTPSASTSAVTRPTTPTVREPEMITGRGWSKKEFQQRSQRLHGNCTTRELFHYLTNVEFYPEILPVAEKYARDRLERSLAMLWKGERPIPADHYDPAALERWVYAKHRQQVDAYRAPGVRPDVDRQAFIEASVQLAPIVLIDGGWLQGVASPALIHTVVGRMMFHVMVEEIGEGNAEEHHANIYRNLLASMGEEAPPVDSSEFAHWSRLRDSSFEVPTLWLAISCFPRHFLPEILGLNLAVEIAGIGGPYMEARDTLKRFGYPTLFVDVHNAADNVAAGHSAWAMNAIKRHLDEVAERDGPHGLDHTWHRVWSGLRATLPQIGRMRLMAHRVAKRLFGDDPSLVPLIFPS